MQTLTFKVSDTEAAAIRDAAREKHRDLSEFLREAAVSQTTPQEGRFIPERDPVTGFWRNAAPNQPQYTHEELKTFLADFP